MKLIKLNESHYIVVDDSEIKQDDFVIALDTKTVFKCNQHEAEKPIKQFKDIYNG